MTRNYFRSYASAFAIVIALGCSGCTPGRAPTGFATRALSSLAAVSSPWRDDTKGFDRDALSVLASDDRFAETARVAREAELARRAADPKCVALYARVALDCWPALQAANDTTEPNEINEAAWDVYHHSVAQFVQQGTVHNRLDPSGRVSLVFEDREPVVVPISHHGFPWEKADFSELHGVLRKDQDIVQRYWSQQGLGVPMVAVCRRAASDGYMGKDVPFAATCILRPQEETPTPSGMSKHVTGEDAGEIAAVLEIHDPLRVNQVSYQQRQWDLASDVTAPLVLASRDTDRNTFSNFLNPARTDELGGLRMLEPYQPGKIPIVVVHGLLSDKFTWVDLVNDLRFVEDVNEHYQIWTFQYRTGQPFVRSAAEMRRDLSEAVDYLDPNSDDEAIANMVLVGHSMGGLVSKLLVSYSDTSLWDSVASRRVEEIKTSPEIRDEIEELFFFEPLPYVKRVVFIGSPHRGAAMAKGVIGRLGSALVMTPDERESRFKEFVRSNPDVFTGDLANRLPSSIDLLRPDNPLLLAAYKLRVNSEVGLHTIIGTGREFSDGTPSDGVVAVQSARHPGTLSELQINATHTKLTSHPKTTEELVRILGEHVNQNHTAAAKLARSSRSPRLALTSGE
ncbi:Alpha/beta hydrolase family protein [Planctomycetes bacterium CA13]|uniref:Alpha/beta hydrolase family protein n=1 Tax=Novipirellula herctigrandis TaxID=2527986 RepID=A0A5C5ZAN9_9BACT|nr:Alpha/beta hydrolase family protein [Planctomycetes bacterium CA13]